VQEGLKRALRTPEVLFIGMNGVIGGGIFLLPGQVSALAGHQAPWSYLIAGLVAIMIGLSFAEASSMFNETGGSYMYAERAMGQTIAASVGWMSWLTLIVGWAALSNGLMGYVTSLVPSLAPAKDWIAAGVIVALCLLNSLGVRKGSWAVIFFSIVKLIPLALLVIVGLFIYAHHTPAVSALSHSAPQISKAVLVLIYAYGGFEMATVQQGEMVHPRKSAVIGVIGTLVGVTLFYLLIQEAAVKLDPSLATSATPLADAGRNMFLGGATVMTIGAVLSILGTKSGVALTAPRILYALSLRRGLPGILAKISPRFQTPIVSIWVTGVIVIILSVTGTFEHLLMLNVAARLYEYLAVCVSVIVLRFRAKNELRSFRLPFGVAIPAIAAGLCIWLLSQETAGQLLLALAALAIGMVLYGISRRTQAKSSGHDRDQQPTRNAG